jgi:4-carboxymuconolactone decarboxylase
VAERDEHSRAELGRALRARAQGARNDELQAALASLDPELADWADEFVFGRVWARGGLGFEERQLVAVAALAATGNVDQLRNYLHGALQGGVPPEKIHEALVMICVYAGFPAAIRALGVWKDVQASHERAGDA